ncbi:hypothetical protein Salat_1685600 [Sesamum alatum]|uniref:DUF4283 domain-containing protein n=1 Tax=Sesamum alatum TaxID=300844 RepID=A0AAE1Y7C0_9LAMI|nr:hypothetical protein Salat_1685600 [Sesamum alatum]
MRSTLEDAFNPIWGMETKLIEDNRILFRFRHYLDRKRVFDTAPWAYEKNLLVLGMVNDDENPRHVNLDWCDFHVLVHDLPIGKMHKDMDIFVGNQLGHFKDVDMDGSDRFAPDFRALHYASESVCISRSHFEGF